MTAFFITEVVLFNILNVFEMQQRAFPVTIIKLLTNFESIYFGFLSKKFSLYMLIKLTMGFMQREI